MLGGDIAVESAPGLGSTFMVRLPVDLPPVSTEGPEGNRTGPDPHVSPDRVASTPDGVSRRCAGMCHLRQIVAGVNDGVILVGPDRTIPWANNDAVAPFSRNPEVQVRVVATEKRSTSRNQLYHPRVL